MKSSNPIDMLNLAYKLLNNVLNLSFIFQS